MSTIPTTLPAEVNDRIMAVMDQVISHLMIQLELTFEHELDVERLCLDAEPVPGAALWDTQKSPTGSPEARAYSVNAQEVN